MLQLPQDMDTKSKILLWVLILATAGSIGFTFYRTVIKQDFEVINIESEEDTLEDETALSDEAPLDETSESEVSDEETAPESGE